MDALLNAVEVRVVGALVEKQMATPEYYPLTLNALVNACNQKSSREPVVHYDDATVEQALELLQSKGLATRLSGPGHRVEKFGHRLGDGSLQRWECLRRLRELDDYSEHDQPGELGK